jgi:hypothetical protein
VELDARVGAGPGGMADLIPQIARLDGLGTLPSVRRISAQSASSFTAFRKASVTRTELLEFWPDTVM